MKIVDVSSMEENNQQQATVKIGLWWETGLKWLHHFSDESLVR